MIATLASWVIIIVYLWWRFHSFTYGLAAVLAVVHDVLITLGAIAVSYWLAKVPGLNTLLQIDQFKIDLPIVAAFLTLIGFSVNDTIVIFDRIREIKGKTPHLTNKMVNDAINQTLSRTILTSFTAWLVVVILYFFGGEGLHGFAFALVVGFLSGTYSTVYIATPILIDWVATKPEPPPRSASNWRPAASSEKVPAGMRACLPKDPSAEEADPLAAVIQAKCTITVDPPPPARDDMRSEVDTHPAIPQHVEPVPPGRQVGITVDQPAQDGLEMLEDRRQEPRRHILVEAAAHAARPARSPSRGPLRAHRPGWSRTFSPIPIRIRRPRCGHPPVRARFRPVCGHRPPDRLAT